MEQEGWAATATKEAVSTELEVAKMAMAKEAMVVVTVGQSVVMVAMVAAMVLGRLGSHPNTRQGKRTPTVQSVPLSITGRSCNCNIAMNCR